MLFASDKQVSKLTVFAGASLALVITSAIGVLAGTIDRTTSAKTIDTAL
jgi:putative Ca2+/H+ antiporter (TMEM165/GDT1 family)